MFLRAKKKYEAHPIFGQDNTPIWVYSVIGEIAQWAILSAVARYDQRSDLRSGALWAQTRLEETVDYYEKKTAAEQSLLSYQEIMDAVRSYKGQVGPVSWDHHGYHQRPDVLVSADLPDEALTDDDRRKVLYQWSSTGRRLYPCLTLLLQESFQTFGQKIAVSQGDRQLSYHELDQRSDHLAALLQQRGVSSGDLVGLACDRSPDMIVAITSILKLGAGYVPLNGSLPSRRLEFMMDETGLSLVLTQKNFGEMPIIDDRLIYFDEFSAGKEKTGLQKQPLLEPVEHSTSNTAYVIYTSGSTGMPKGVAISHQALANFAKATVNKYQMTEHDRVLQFASISFDASIEEIFPTLISGGQLVLRTESMLDSYPGFMDRCKKNKITILNLPTSFWSELVRDSKLQSHPNPLPDDLRTVIVGGDKLDPQALSRWDKLAAGEVDLWDTYGPTETTVVAISKRLRGLGVSPPQTEEVLTIGRPDENVCVYIVDETLNPVPIGEKGELLIGGANLGEYLNQPDLNQKKFIDNPFSLNEEQGHPFSGKLYRTGDLVKYQANGELVFLGRKDNQVKIRGFRVELDEVEAVMRAHPGVREAIVLAPERNGLKELVAAVVFEDGEGDPSDVLRGFLSEELPYYMIPSSIIPFTSFSRTIGEKINRSKVLSEALENLEKQVNEEDPPTVEFRLIRIWQEVLGVPIDRSSSFFSNGGHSLTVMKVIGRTNDLLNVDLTAKEFFQNPTIKEQVVLIEQKIGNIGNDSLGHNGEGLQTGLPLSDVREKDVQKTTYELSAPQRQYYLHDRLNPKRPLYNEPLVLTLNRSVSPEELEKALQQLMSRHDVLRHSFHQSESAIYQRCHGQVSIGVDYSDFSQETSEKAIELLYDEAGRQLKRLFNLEEPGLLRCSMFKLGPDDYRIFFVTHHLIMDGSSFYEIFLPELDALLDGRQLAPTHSESVYRSFATDQFDLDDERRVYWKGILERHQRLMLPSDHTVENPSVSGAQTLRKIPNVAIKEVSERMGVTRFNVIGTALSILLGRYSQNEWISLGVIHNQRPVNFPNTMGVFSNTALVQTHYDHRSCIDDCILSFRDSFLEAMENVIPNEKLVEIGHSINVVDLIQVAVIYEPLYQRNKAFDIDMHFVHSGTAKFNLLFRFEEQANGVVLLCLEYSTDLFTASSINRMIEHLENILSSMQADIHQPLGQLCFLAEQEKRLLEGDQCNYLPLRCPDLFEHQVTQSPHNVAISFGTEMLTYTELNALSNQFSHFFLEKGITNGVPVGIYLSRSIRQIAVLLATQKIGAVAVPLDPAYPRERLESIIEQTNLKHLLTESS